MANTMLRPDEPRWQDIADAERTQRLADAERTQRREVLAVPIAERLRRGQELSRQAVRLRDATAESAEPTR